MKKGEGVKWGEDGRKEVRAGKERRVTNVITGSLKIEARRSQVLPALATEQDTIRKEGEEVRNKSKPGVVMVRYRVAITLTSCQGKPQVNGGVF